MWVLRPIDFTDLQDWAIDDHLAALNAFARQSLKPADETYRQGTMGAEPQCFTQLAQKAETIAAKRLPRLFFEENFTPYLVSNMAK